MSNNRSASFIFCYTVFLLSLLSCGPRINTSSPPNNIDTIVFRASEAPEWTALFNRTSGWVGGDGIFSIPLNGVDTAGGARDTSTLIVFSDTILGEIENGKFKGGFRFINNSVALLDGVQPLKDRLSFHWSTTTAGRPQSVFVPRTKQSGASDYYWLGDGFVNKARNNDIYLFAYRIQPTKAKVFAFKEVGNVLLVIPAGSRPPFENLRQLDTDLAFKNDSSYNGSLGAGVLLNSKSSGAARADGYLYVYGILGRKKEVVVGRVKPAEVETFSKWRFWDGKGWSADKTKVAAIADRASNELSVTPLPDGRYAMIFQVDGISNIIGMRIGATPVGPFGRIIPVWNCAADTKLTPHLFAYNAKAHPGLSNKGELLISYNVNSFDAENDLNAHPNHYRPRFIKIRWE